jgi:hypothetical protein
LVYPTAVRGREGQNEDSWVRFVILPFLNPLPGWTPHRLPPVEQQPRRTGRLESLDFDEDHSSGSGSS